MALSGHEHGRKHGREHVPELICRTRFHRRAKLRDDTDIRRAC